MPVSSMLAREQRQKERLTLAEAWRPFRSYATVSLWR